MESLYGDDLELFSDEYESVVLVDFAVFENNENSNEEKRKISFPVVKVDKEQESRCYFPNVEVKQEPKLYIDLKQELPTNTTFLLEEALLLNRELQKDLEVIINGIENTTVYNLYKQKELEKEIVILKKKILQSEDKESEKAHKKPLLTISSFGAPYFKSNLVLEGFAPINGDVEIARKLNFRPIMFPSKKIKMTDSEETSLHEAVKKEVIRLEFELKIKPEERKLEEKLEIQKKEGRSTKTTLVFLSNLKRRIENLEKKEHALFRNLAVHHVDLIRWDAIAFDIFPAKYEYTAEFLRLWWKNYLRPDILKGEKTTAEKKALKHLLAKVDLNVGVSWPDIANQLARKTKSRIKRSPFDCFSYFQRRLNRYNRKLGWSLEDGAKLSYSLCENVYVDSFGRRKVDWGEIRPHFLGRTVAQMWSHFKYQTDIAHRSLMIKNTELRRQELNKKADMEAKLKPRGRRPQKIPPQDELQQLLRPLGKSKQGRQRTLSLPGDGRRDGPVLAAFCRLLGINFDMTKLPKVEKGVTDLASIQEFYDSGIEEKDLQSYRVLSAMIPEFPIEHDEYCTYYMSGETPPLESLLPPSLHTVAGLRGLLLWSDSIASQVEEKYVKLEEVDSTEELYQASDIDIQELQIEDMFGDPEADKRLLFFMESIFGLTGDIAGIW